MVNLFASFFLIYAIYAVVNPFLQVMLRNMGYSYELVGLLLSLFEVAGFIGPLLLGHHVDRKRDMKRTMLLSILATTTGVVLLLFSQSLLVTVVSLLVFGFFLRSLFPLIDSYTNNLYDGDAQTYTVLRSAGTVGYVFFSLVFAFTNRPNLESNNSIGAYCLLSILLFLFPVLGWKREVAPVRNACPLESEQPGRWYDRAFVVGMVIIALNRFSMSSISSFFSLYLVEELQVNAISLLNAIAAGSEFGAMILAGRLLQKGKVLPVQLLIISGFGMVIRLLIYAFFPTFTGALVAQLLHSVCYGFLHPAAVFLVSRRVRRSHRTIGMSIYVSLGTGLPSVLGSMLGGVVVAYGGYQLLFSSFSLFSVASVLIALLFYKTMTAAPMETV